MGNERRPRGKDSIDDPPVADATRSTVGDTPVEECGAQPAIQFRSATDFVAWDEV